MSPKNSFDWADFIHTLKVAGYSATSAFIVVMASFVTPDHVPAQYAFLVPIANVIIVAIERYLSDHTGQVEK